MNIQRLISIHPKDEFTDTLIGKLYKEIHDIMIHEPNHLTVPTLFEYWCAVQLSLHYNIPIIPWKMMSPQSKKNGGIRTDMRDKGVDCASPDFRYLVQVKHYGEKSTICYGGLATFIAFQTIFLPKINGTKLILARTHHSLLSEDIQQAISNEAIIDHPFDNTMFTEGCKKIYGEYILQNEEEKRKEQSLRPPQIEALELLGQSDREKKNCILSIPTGVGKTRIVLEYAKRSNACICVFVPTLVLLDQWYDEAVEYGFDRKKVLRIGTSSKDKLTTDPTNIYSLVICVNNSVGKVSKYISFFKKIIVDEAHQIKRPCIYKEEEDEMEDDCKTDDETESDEEEKHFVILKRMISSRSNVVLMSATIDRLDPTKYLYYMYLIREAIEHGYLCDYQLVCPIFSDCPDDSNIATYLIQQGECHCIVFCDTIKQADLFTNLLNSLLPHSARSVHSELTKSKREMYIQEFKDSQIRFLVNVRVLVEGFNCPIASSCVFLHLPSSDTFSIQAIGRCLRLYPGKIFANIYLPFNKNEDSIDISRFITEIGKKDPVIRQAWQDKNVGTYINLQVQCDKKVEETDDSGYDQMVIEDEATMVELRFNMIFNSLGRVDDRGVEWWMGKFEQLKEFFRVYDRLPSILKESEKSLYKWLDNQKQYFKKNGGIMKDPTIYSTWKTFISLDEFAKHFRGWKQTLHVLKDFLTTHNRLPSKLNVEEKILYKWCDNQRYNFTKRSGPMKDPLIYNMWYEFTISTEFNKYFISNTEEWKQNFQKLKEFLTTHNRLPSKLNVEEKILYKWRDAQTQNFRKRSGIMRDTVFYNKWEEFITSDEFKKYFILNTEEWKQNLRELKDFLTTHNRLPSKRKEDEKKLCRWRDNQKQKFNKRSDIMNDQMIYNMFITSTEFKKYF